MKSWPRYLCRPAWATNKASTVALLLPAIWFSVAALVNADPNISVKIVIKKRVMGSAKPRSLIATAIAD